MGFAGQPGFPEIKGDFRFPTATVFHNDFPTHVRPAPGHPVRSLREARAFSFCLSPRVQVVSGLRDFVSTVATNTPGSVSAVCRLSCRPCSRHLVFRIRHVDAVLGHQKTPDRTACDRPA
jgi:hypothetical protein